MTVIYGQFRNTFPGCKITNPFIYRLKISFIDILMLPIQTVFILPIRVVLTSFLITLAWIFSCVGLIGLSVSDLEQKPLAAWRCKIRSSMQFIIRLTYFAASLQRIKVKGQCATLTQAPIIVAAPHTSNFDSILKFFLNSRSPIITPKSSRMPFIRKIVNFLQPIHVRREDQSSRKTATNKMIDRILSDDVWPQILIFPEATYTNGSCLTQFKTGAFIPGTPIQPVLIRYPNNSSKFIPVIGRSFLKRLKVLWITLTRFHTNCEIEFLPVYFPSIEETLNPYLYATNVRNLMAIKLGIPVSDLTTEDWKMIGRAEQMNIPLATEIVAIKKLRNYICLDKTNIEKDIIRSSAVSNYNSFLNLTEFSRHLRISDKNPAAIELFNMFDMYKTGYFDFQKYLKCAVFIIYDGLPLIQLMQMMANLYKMKEISSKLTPSTFHCLVRWTMSLSRKESDEIFKQIDVNKTNKISFNEFQSFLKNQPKFSYIFQSTNRRMHF